RLLEFDRARHGSGQPSFSPRRDRDSALRHAGASISLNPYFRAIDGTERIGVRFTGHKDWVGIRNIHPAVSLSRSPLMRETSSFRHRIAAVKKFRIEFTLQCCGRLDDSETGERRIGGDGDAAGRADRTLAAGDVSPWEVIVMGIMEFEVCRQGRGE